MTIREAERVVVQRARRLSETARMPVSGTARVSIATELAELVVAVEALEEAEGGARFAAKRHTEGGDW